MTDRLPTSIFDLPVKRIRSGHYSATYFNRAKKILENNQPDKQVCMQVFQKNHAVLAGIDEAIAILRSCSGRTSTVSPDGWFNQWHDLEVRALNEGDIIEPWEPILTIRGPLSAFVHLESLYLGVLARGTKVATNVNTVVEAANGKPILFFADRFDRFENQAADGWAAQSGGAAGLATEAMVKWFGPPSSGTMPHALIAACDGKVVKACELFHSCYPDENLIALVDFNNDCVQSAVECLKRFPDHLWGVRLDTSENMVDRSLHYDNKTGDFKPTGVNPRLVFNVRKALDANYGKNVRIIVSGGFNPEKIKTFEAEGAPVDVYAVGSSLLQGSFDFTADVVQPVAKAGRWLHDESRLELVT